MDEMAFSARVRASKDKLFRIAYTILRHEADCADALQEALLNAWRHIGDLRDPAYFDTWLVRILIRECYKLCRTRKHRAVAMPTPALASDNRALHDALHALDERERLPLMLYYLEGYSVDEVASMLRIPPGTVKSRLSRARRNLRDLLDDEEGSL